MTTEDRATAANMVKGRVATEATETITKEASVSWEEKDAVLEGAAPLKEITEFVKDVAMAVVMIGEWLVVAVILKELPEATMKEEKEAVSERVTVVLDVNLKGASMFREIRGLVVMVVAA